MNKPELERSQRKALGKGLSALLPGKNALASRAEQFRNADQPAAAEVRALPEHFEQFESLALDRITAGQDQPRTSFEEDKLDELAQSIKAHGILQPITVSKLPDGKYRIVAGERRWRAARLAGLTEVPALVRIVADDQLLELALIENIQREDLNPIETATAFSRLIHQHRLSHDQVAERTGKDRSTVTNFLRLLKLAQQVQDDLLRGDLSMGHARALLALPDHGDQRKAAQQVIDKRLSVRETERLVKMFNDPPKPPQQPEKPAPQPDANIRAAVEELKSALGTKVKLVPRSPTSGKIEIEYYSQDDLDRIYSVIVRN